MCNAHIMFFGFFAAVFLLCAAAEWMFAKESLMYAHKWSKSKGEKHLLAAVVVSDGISIVLNVAGWCWAYESLNNGWLICSSKLHGELLVSLLCSLLLTPLTWLVVVFGGTFAVVMTPPIFIFWLPLLCMGLLSFASPIMRAKVMWRSECRPWLKWPKLLFVVYATFWPVALAIPFMASR